MGKYSSVTPRLPQYQQESSYQDKVNEEKDKVLDGMANTSSAALVHKFVALRGEIDGLKAQLKEHNLTLEALSQLIADTFDDEDVTSLKIPGASVRVQVEPYAQVQDKEVFREWCLIHGLAESLMLPWQTTNSITKERLLAGKPEPDGVEAFQKNKLVLTRDKS